ncbi:MAG: Asp-tRNA(Asn)/Glu-tRNA(Gln) amidotransferase subunit GatB [Candidatus Bipolaricaulota bacterium]|nr:Asp-tRNA(Asn)/Glu-tRNA(Gln) amidotransferase subunit GatB [Candidatus Bipolaricaulota bacterium]MDW8152481.1 Asp-tRNA(Asn)/Glu-tRNA(Gln) amidotransferase subunit GatB [Candidatus Bipolaricaulota bacterium]
MDVVIGLEIHVQLLTRTKLFCPCRADYFAAPPNTLTCPVCLGLPGALPVLNRRAVDLALRVALALGAQIQEVSQFDRKNYFYPDLPKGYQITQREAPLARGGALPFRLAGQTRTVRIRELHLEEDAGKLVHTEQGTLIDFNRCGVPLVEIVTEPDLRSPQEAREFLRALRTLLRHLRVSTADMEKGELRCDANLSLGHDGRLGTKTEIKNLNSFRAVERALQAAADHQRALLARGERVEPVTFGWDEAREELVLQRTKEEAHDYRYFPDPDLVPLVVTPAWLARVRAELPELPWEREARWLREFGLSPAEAEALLADPARADYFEAVARGIATPRAAAGWVLAELGPYWTGEAPPVPAADLVALIRAVEEGRITRPQAKEILERAARGEAPIPALLAHAATAVRDEETLRRLAEEVVREHPQAVADYRAGRTQALGFLVGQAMRKAQGRADPKRLAHVLQALLSGE